MSIRPRGEGRVGGSSDGFRGEVELSIITVKLEAMMASGWGQR